MSNTNNCPSLFASGSSQDPDKNKDFDLSQFRAYVNSANDGIFVICNEMKFHVVNQLLESWLGASESTLTANDARLPITHFFGAEEHKSLFIRQFQNATSGHPVRFECQLHPQQAAARWVEISMNKVDRADEVHVIGVVRDITERKIAMAEIERQAIHDELTGLVNRREFSRRLEVLLEQAKLYGTHHSLLYMDLDQFKVVNDTCGHVAGDELLRQLSCLIKTKVRFSDTFARLGGDEFGVLLMDCSMEQAKEIAELFRQTISNFRFHWEEKRFEIGVSIGVAPIVADSDNAAGVLSSADAACYVAKDKGRNRIHQYHGGEEFTRKRGEMNWISRITQAFEEYRFRLYYQNIMPITSQYACLEHREILLRMIDENGDVVSPAEFIPAAEKYNLMPTIDRWVIRTLFSKKHGHWRKMLKSNQEWNINSNLFCSVNLSGASLNDDYFLDFLRDQITLNDVPANAICFEITETMAINNLQRVSSFIQELKDIGFRFALDDFGSGMSSFTYLKSLPVDFLKIDGGLVKGIADSKIDYCMVESINRIAQEMGILTIAEYVENDAILEKLKEIGVSYAQGFGIHQPESLA